MKRIDYEREEDGCATIDENGCHTILFKNADGGIVKKNINT